MSLKKIVVIGDGGVGKVFVFHSQKNSFKLRFFDAKFTPKRNLFILMWKVHIFYVFVCFNWLILFVFLFPILFVFEFLSFHFIYNMKLIFALYRTVFNMQFRFKSFILFFPFILLICFFDVVISWFSLEKKKSLSFICFTFRSNYYLFNYFIFFFCNIEMWECVCSNNEK